eukprot:763398-Hanusia_phi.AAC.5
MKNSSDHRDHGGLLTASMLENSDGIQARAPKCLDADAREEQEELATRNLRHRVEALESDVATKNSQIDMLRQAVASLIRRVEYLERARDTPKQLSNPDEDSLVLPLTSSKAAISPQEQKATAAAPASPRPREEEILLQSAEAQQLSPEGPNLVVKSSKPVRGKQHEAATSSSKPQASVGSKQVRKSLDRLSLRGKPSSPRASRSLLLLLALH